MRAGQSFTPEEADRKIKAAYTIWFSPQMAAMARLNDEIKALESEYHRKARDLIGLFRATHPDCMKDWMRSRQDYHTR